MDNEHDAEIDVVMLNARGKALVVGRTGNEFSVAVLDKIEFERLATERPHFTAKTISGATKKARQAVESEGV